MYVFVRTGHEVGATINTNSISWGTEESPNKKPQLPFSSQYSPLSALLQHYN